MLVKKRQAGFSLIELMIVVAIAMVIAAFAVPGFMQALRNYRIGGDVQAIKNEILLAKMRAAANFTRSRVLFQRSGDQTFRTQLWNKTTDTWEDVEVGAPQLLSSGISYGFLPMTTPPAGTQTTLGLANPCRLGSAGDPGGGAVIGGTTCLIFNSRGFPVDNAGTVDGERAIYVRDGEAVQGVTVSITGNIQAWRGEPVTDTWVER